LNLSPSLAYQSSSLAYQAPTRVDQAPILAGGPLEPDIIYPISPVSPDDVYAKFIELTNPHSASLMPHPSRGLRSGRRASRHSSIKVDGGRVVDVPPEADAICLISPADVDDADVKFVKLNIPHSAPLDVHHTHRVQSGCRPSRHFSSKLNGGGVVDEAPTLANEAPTPVDQTPTLAEFPSKPYVIDPIFSADVVDANAEFAELNIPHYSNKAGEVLVPVDDSLQSSDRLHDESFDVVVVNSSDEDLDVQMIQKSAGY